MRTSNRRARVIGAALAATLALVTVIAPVGAAGRLQPVSITATSYFDVFPYGGPWMSTGSLLCRHGTQHDDPDSFVWIDTGSQRFIHIQLAAIFTCEDNPATARDEGGTFRIQRQIYIDTVANKEAFTWTVQGGTGAYRSLGGGGVGVTEAGVDPVRGDFHIGHFYGFLSD